MNQPYTTIRPLVSGDVLTLNLLDRRMVESDHVARFEQEVTDAIRSRSQTNVILNFDAVEFLSSAALSALITTRALVDERGGRLAICNLSKDIGKMFKITKLDSQLKVHASLEKARAALE